MSADLEVSLVLLHGSHWFCCLYWQQWGSSTPLLLISTYKSSSEAAIYLGQSNIRYHIQKVSDKGAVLMIIWNVFFISTLLSVSTNLTYNRTQHVEASSLTVLYPLARWLADCWIARYCVLKACCTIVNSIQGNFNVYSILNHYDLCCNLSVVDVSSMLPCMHHSVHHWSVCRSIRRGTQFYHLLAPLGPHNWYVYYTNSSFPIYQQTKCRQWSNVVHGIYCLLQCCILFNGKLQSLSNDKTTTLQSNPTHVWWIKLC